MTDKANTSPRGGFHYHVSDDQLTAFARLTLLQRLEWVEAAREFTWLSQTPETRAMHQMFREGLPLTPSGDARPLPTEVR